MRGDLKLSPTNRATISPIFKWFKGDFTGDGELSKVLVRYAPERFRAFLANRVDSVFTRFGDQGIRVRRSFYDTLGGIPPWPLFEDVALFQQARQLSRVHWLPGRVKTSAGRFNERGLFRQRLLNAELMLRYLAGASPFALAARYKARSDRTRRPRADRMRAARESQSIVRSCRDA